MNNEALKIVDGIPHKIGFPIIVELFEEIFAYTKSNQRYLIMPNPIVDPISFILRFGEVLTVTDPKRN